MKCLHCNSKDIVKRGFRYNDLGKRQLYLCRKCGKKFTPGLRRHRYPPSLIFKCVAMRKGGKKLKDIQNYADNKGFKVSLWTISKWHDKFKYSRSMKNK